ncbi:MAG: hypothetical protein A3J07_01030 [Candidatus Doudnabacteria bacterium RIFCSPLOWO2_02_FULL_49_13]|uniref:DUF4446 domain-containing protein n=1 Tax=Candidatus Doudnabacteria bacterium RIFCSPHIGHO2_12_FULL_48_16 TaxID=1817838 RepID=A0A1F5PK59_9BACT|nr:MAG: hypothetical protein A3B77_03960 [Candidatus Doudnabacteria bacterium RIFCSPHIGHO2_02_FULL_49_24]OGE88643.1 MAG: hypothetical protein A2760_01620 [Candidatus Doudnabacteria bacterium RIFCSPHIGHO2_01_FULL_50_67]OGE90328.1 MAG: hypothetical protein A3E29_04540 [Candidatus Doudnabacteria bacterium RIFCSPHIGHO2_12_FULL_48_16]OGE97035.1 MAG: hypothetical protein A2990_01530 [Candidatus Doudnabacteria bacterium RIFCSPLOWO2_01_FULL_49_40]OGF02384.1 MAG: hypothetical protein A3J07_01030 [Candid
MEIFMDSQYLALISTILSVALLIIVFWQALKLHRLDRMRREFFSSGLKKDLEQILIDQNRSISKITQQIKEIDESLDTIFTGNRNNIQKVGFVRFNPFDDAGGNISFTLALLNAKDEGVVMSSLHGRDGTRVYAKAVKAGRSETQLTEEEMQAIKDAK